MNYKINISKFFKNKYGKGDFNIVDDKLVYESEKGDIIEADLPQNLKDNAIKNYTEKKEVETDMTKKEKDKDKKEDMTEDAKETEMEAKYVKLGETYEDPDPEVKEAARKHVDMDKKDEAEMEAETPEQKKKEEKESAKDMVDLINSLKADFTAQFETLKKQNDELKNDLAKHREREIAEEKQVKNDMMEDLAKRYRVPLDWLKAKEETYKGDFISDFTEGLQYAFGTYDFEIETKEDMATGGSLLKKVGGLE